LLCSILSSYSYIGRHKKEMPSEEGTPSDVCINPGLIYCDAHGRHQHIRYRPVRIFCSVRDRV